MTELLNESALARAQTTLRLAAVGLFVAVIPLFLISTNVRLVVNWPSLYSTGFDKYDIPSRTGIERSELISAGHQIRDYFNNDDELIDVRIFVGGILRSLFNNREILHMKDVKGLRTGRLHAAGLHGTVHRRLRRSRAGARLARLRGPGSRGTWSTAASSR